MRIQHNILSMNAYRNYGNNTSALGKNLEKLSSGYKINRAGDDAAGLAISEKMRAQIKGLDAAQKNVKDGISLVKTAEGAMQEVQDMLSRMKYLATQSANGTYDSEVDRTNLQREVDQLKEEIDRIGKNANFNGIYLLNGDYDGKKVTLGAGGDDTTPGVTTETFGKITATSTPGTKTKTAGFTAGTKAAGTPVTGATADMSGTTVTDVSSIKAINNLSVGGVTVDLSTLTISGNDATTDVIAAIKGAIDAAVTAANTTGAGGTANYDKIENVQVAAKGNSGFEVTFDSTPQTHVPVDTPVAAKLEIDFGTATGEDVIGGKLTVGDKTYEFVEDANDAATGNVAIVVGKTDDADTVASALQTELAKDTTGVGAKFTVGTATNGKITITESATTPTGNETPPTVDGEGFKAATGGGAADDGIGMTLQIGDSTAEKLTMSIGTISQAALGITNVNIGTPDGAATAVNTIKDAINYVSGVRGLLGAYQNRLEHTQNNLSVMHENIQDAESTIRDTDVADEMMAYTKNNILVQSAQAMLAQANAVPQGVLQLLQ